MLPHAWHTCSSCSLAAVVGHGGRNEIERVTVVLHNTLKLPSFQAFVCTNPNSHAWSWYLRSLISLIKLHKEWYPFMRVSCSTVHFLTLGKGRGRPAVQGLPTALLYSNPLHFDVVNELYKECLKPLILHKLDSNSTLLKISGKNIYRTYYVYYPF